MLNILTPALLGFCALVGAITIGVFIGMFVEKRMNQGLMELKEEHIATLQKSVKIRDDRIALEQQAAEFYKSLLGERAPEKPALNG